ncbi:MAG: hypothetical protein Q9201_001160 [Fulgogasparrea decipioides]
MHSTVALLCSLLPLALGSPITARQASEFPPVNFGVIAARSASPIHLQSINAAGGAFWIQKDTATYCPLTNQTQCPPGKDSVFSVGGGGASLDTEVPGGQLVYVSPTGALGFTQAHSAYIPPGSALQTFNATVTSDNGPIGHFTFEGLGATGFIACPASKGQGPWKVFADIEGLKDEDVPSKCKNDCLGFSALTAPYSNEAAAWQYT